MTKKEAAIKYLKKREQLKNSEVKLSFEAPAKIMSQFIDQAIQKLGQEIKVDGFRLEKVPRGILEQKVGQERILYEAAELAIKKIYVDAIIGENIAAIGEPKIDLEKVEEEKALKFSATVGILPEVNLKKNWKNKAIKVNQKYQGEKVKVSSKEIDREVEFLANQRVKLITVNREAKKKDQVEIDFQVLVNNVPIENGTAKKHLLVLGENKFIPGFEDQLIGLKAGEKKDFELTFPKEYHVKHLAGKLAQFKVKINLVQDRQIPEINDEFAAGIGKFKTLEDLRKNIKEGIEHEKKHQQKDLWKKELLDAVVDESEFEVPNVLIENELESIMAELIQEVSQIGLTKEKYLEQIKKTEQELRSEWRKRVAPRRVRAALILKDLAEKNKLQPDSEEIEKQVNRTLQYYSSLGQVSEKIDIQRLYEMTKGTLTNEKVIDYLMKIK